MRFNPLNSIPLCKVSKENFYSVSEKWDSFNFEKLEVQRTSKQLKSLEKNFARFQ